MADVHIRLGRPGDVEQLASMCNALWPDGPVEEHRRELVPKLLGKAPGMLPVVVFVAERDDGELVGFLEAGLRSHADGCDPATPVGYVEGWYVLASQRRKGVGAQLLAVAQDWARGQGCIEMASDTWFDNELSQRVHQALGFEVVDRCVNYRKRL